MKRAFHDIWIRKRLEGIPEVAALASAASPDALKYFANVADIVVPGNTMAEKIDNGKRTLVVDRRSSSLLDTFVNHDEGSVCPSFPKLVPSTNCPYGCQYCFLAGTYRACRPFVCAYVVDLASLEREIRRHHGNKAGTTVISAGEMSDPLACDALSYMPRIVEMFGRLDKVKLLLLTKSGHEEIQPLLGAHHNGHTIASWSITCDEVVARYEPGNEGIASRLAAAKAAQDAGYEVRFRLDPVMLVDNWKEEFARTIHQVYGLGIRPSRFTLGSFRLLGNLRGIIKARFPESDILQQPLFNEAGKRWRYPHETREELYKQAITSIHEHDETVPVALCKETPEMHRAVDGLIDRAKCNCLP